MDQEMRALAKRMIIVMILIVLAGSLTMDYLFDKMEQEYERTIPGRL